MKWVQTTIIAGLAFFLSAGISFAAEMDDLDLTIRVIETDDLKEMHNELRLPDMASDAAREHAEGENGHGLTQANAAREQEMNQEAKNENQVRLEEHDEHEGHRDERMEDNDERNEDRVDRDQEREEAHHDEKNELEHSDR